MVLLKDVCRGSALHGLLAKIRNLNLTLIAVNRIPGKEPECDP